MQAEAQGVSEKLRVMRRYDSMGWRVYEECYRDEQVPKLTEALKWLNVSGSEVILDLGCGTGLSMEVVETPPAAFVGLDFSSGMVTKAVERIRGTWTHLVLSDADYQPFRSGVFHGAVAVTLLNNMPDPEKTLRELVRVLREGSRVSVTGLKKSFSVEDLRNVLETCGLRVHRILDRGLRDYVALCTSMSLEATERAFSTTSRGVLPNTVAIGSFPQPPR